FVVVFGSLGVVGAADDLRDDILFLTVVVHERRFLEARAEPEDSRRPLGDVVPDRVLVFRAHLRIAGRRRTCEGQESEQQRRDENLPCTHGSLRSQSSTSTPFRVRGLRNAILVPWLPSLGVRSISSSPVAAACFSARSRSGT